VICPLVEIFPWMYGALSTLESSTMAMRRPRFSVVSRSIRRAPSADMVKATTGSPPPLELSTDGRASEM
jgi:hypothetical protein